MSRLLIVLSLCTTLIACDGSGGDSPTTSEPGTGPSTQNPGEAPADSPAPNESPTPNETPAPDSPTPSPSDPATPVTGEPSTPPQNPADVTSAIRVVIADNGPAPGIAGGSITRIDDQAMNSDAWVAVAANLRVNNRNSAAIWRGENGNLVPILRALDTIGGFPENIWFENAVDVEIASDTSVWALVVLGGAGNGERALIRIKPDGTSEKILAEGERFITSVPDLEIRTFNFLKVSGNKAYLSVMDGSNFNDFLVDVSTPQPVVVAVDQSFRGDPANFTSILSDCLVRGNNIERRDSVLINATGTVAFTASLRITFSNDSPCPETAVVSYNDNGLSYITVRTPQGNQTTRQGSLWASAGSETPRLVALQDETFPPNDDRISSSDLSNPSASTRGRHRIANNESFALITGSSSENNAVLSGFARQEQPYETLANPGATQLTRVIGSNQESVPGFTASSSFSSIGGIILNNAGQIWFLATARDNNGESDSFTGLWRSDINGATPELELSLTDNFTLNGSTQSLTLINGYIATDSGNLLIGGRVGFTDYVLFK